SFNKKYYNPTNNECLDTCTKTTDLQYALPLDTGTNAPQKCIEKCPSPSYFITKTDSVDTSIKYLECVDSCPTGSYTKLDIKTKECLSACSSDNHYDFNNVCYPKCDVSQNLFYINTDTFECVLACPTELKKIVKIGTDSVSGKDIFLCKSLCEAPLVYRLGDQCVENCPASNNYIGYNQICRSEKCVTDANGEHYYPINEDDTPSPSYFIYKCITSCSEAIINPNDPTKNYLFYTISNPNECLRECPPEFPNYLDSNIYECLSGCPEDLPFFYKTSNNYQCQEENTCSSTAPYFFDGVCLDDCSTNGNYFDSKKRCIDKCKENEYKKLETTTNTYECKEDCGTDYILEGSEPECVEDCPKEKNFIGKDNVCKSSCGEEDGTHYYLKKEITGTDSYKIFKCVDDCKSDYEGFQLKEDNDNKQCYKECTTDYPYLLSEEFKCYSICLNSIKPFSLTTQNNGNEIKICSYSCNDANNKYYGDDKICISNCNQINKITDYDNSCVDKCGEKDTEYKFLLNDKCVNDCGSDNTITPRKLRYSTDDYICKEKCGTGKYVIKESNQCNNTCNGFIDRLIDQGTQQETGEEACVPYCKSINKFYYQIEKICLTSCRNNDKAVEDSNMCVNNCNEINGTNTKYYLFK
ncbi:MAG: hypothetical protein J6O41_08755, partial [Clostridia bacterium]|nr:hypothetical protein [Clostridia bacterium]